MSGAYIGGSVVLQALLCILLLLASVWSQAMMLDVALSARYPTAARVAAWLLWLIGLLGSGALIFLLALMWGARA